jgi:hypothetical protein
VQDTVSHIGDKVHYLAKASFLQDMLLGMFVLSFFYLGKASFLHDMLLGIFGFFCMCHCCPESFLIQQALHPYNISCTVVPQWLPTHWCHQFKVKVKHQGHAMIKVGCQRNPYFLSSFYQIKSKLGVKVACCLLLS